VARIHGIEVAIALLVVACTGADPHAPRFSTSEQTRALSLPFSEAVRAGGLIFVSGQIGNRPGTLDLVPGGIQPEARQALENIRSILLRNGSGMEHVVKCTVFLADVAEWPAFNEVYVEFFSGDRFPARSALGASGLAASARVEVECIAVVGDPEPA
jgi:reactive intermediate/imine deaminase